MNQDHYTTNPSGQDKYDDSPQTSPGILTWVIVIVIIAVIAFFNSRREK